MGNGYTGKILDVDLTENEASVEDLDREDAELFLGGKGLGAKLLWDRSEPGMDPLDPDNPLMFVTGPLTGMSIPTAGRYCVI